MVRLIISVILILALVLCASSFIRNLDYITDWISDKIEDNITLDSDNAVDNVPGDNAGDNSNTGAGSGDGGSSGSSGGTNDTPSAGDSAGLILPAEPYDFEFQAGPCCALWSGFDYSNSADYYVYGLNYVMSEGMANPPYGKLANSISGYWTVFDAQTEGLTEYLYSIDASTPYATVIDLEQLDSAGYYNDAPTYFKYLGSSTVEYTVIFIRSVEKGGYHYYCFNLYSYEEYCFVWVASATEVFIDDGNFIIPTGTPLFGLTLSEPVYS